MKNQNFLQSAVKTIAVCLSFCFALTAQSEVIDRIIAIVGTKPILQSELKDLRFHLKSTGLIDEALISMYDSKELLSNDRAALNYLIDGAILDQMVDRNGVVIPVEQIENEIRSIAQKRGLDKNELRQALQSQKITYSFYQDFIKTTMARSQIIQKEISSKIKITDEEVNSLYVSKFGQSKALVYEYTLNAIYFDASKGGLTAAQSRADEVSKKLAAAPERFDSFASQFSEDANFAQGGLFGTFKASDFNADVEKVIRPMSLGDISAPTKMPDGYRIFKVTKKSLVASSDLERRKPEIIGYLSNIAFQKQFRIWLDANRSESFVRLNNAETTAVPPKGAPR
jgi:peptidyl-prolyl cis-trans isomerase SurA